MSKYIKHSRMGEELNPVTWNTGSPPVSGDYNYINILLTDIDGINFKGSGFSSGGSGYHAMFFGEVILMSRDGADETSGGTLIKRATGPIYLPSGFVSSTYSIYNERDHVNDSQDAATVPFNDAVTTTSDGWWPVMQADIQCYTGTISPREVSFRVRYLVDAAAISPVVHWEINLRVWKPTSP